jgi:hypothetical protein
MDPEYFIFDSLFETVDRLADIFQVQRAVRFQVGDRFLQVEIDTQDPEQDPKERFKGIDDMARLLEAEGVDYEKAREKLLRLDGWYLKDGVLVAPEWMARSWVADLSFDEST